MHITLGDAVQGDLDSKYDICREIHLLQEYDVDWTFQCSTDLNVGLGYIPTEYLLVHLRGLHLKYYPLRIALHHRFFCFYLSLPLVIIILSHESAFTTKTLFCAL